MSNSRFSNQIFSKLDPISLLFVALDQICIQFVVMPHACVCISLVLSEPASTSGVPNSDSPSESDPSFGASMILVMNDY